MAFLFIGFSIGLFIGLVIAESWKHEFKKLERELDARKRCKNGKA